MVRDIYRAKEAQDIDELVAWVKKGKSKDEKSQRLQEAKVIDFYWASFKSDEELKTLANVLEL
jgi:flagellar motor switch protein FliM